KSKETCSVVDLYKLQRHHWCEDKESTCHGRHVVQTAFLMQLIAYTSSRPGALIEQNCYKGLKEDMNLSLLRDSFSTGTILVLEVTTTYLKGNRNTKEPVTYVLYERRDSPIFCPVLNMLALAFADNAFKEEGITRPEDIYNIQIPIFRETLSIQWKPEILETPVFQDATRKPEAGDVVSDSDAWSFAGFNYYLKRFGDIAGFPQRLTSYALRIDAANAVDCKFSLHVYNFCLLILVGPDFTDAQRDQIMGHARADVFRRHYMRQMVKVDTQSHFLGTINRNDLWQTVGLMSAKRDPRAPTTLPHTIINQLEQDSRLVSMNERKLHLFNALKKEYKNLTKAGDDNRKKEHQKLTSQIRARKKTLERTALKEYRAKWFDTVDHAEIQKQLRGEAPSTVDPAPTTYFDWPVRTRIAEFFASYETDKTDDSSETDDSSALFGAVRSLRDLCLQEPSVHKLNCRETGKILCPFCIASTFVRQSDKDNRFQSIYTLKKHVERRHPETISSAAPVYSYNYCAGKIEPLFFYLIRVGEYWKMGAG
ncbi:hypothetical protein FPQ18DRAFT_261175, partial [Pyronema domesticum]